MCGKGSAPPTPGAQSTAFQGMTSPSPVAAPYYSQFLANAQNLYNTTQMNPGILGTAAPINPYQTGAGIYGYDIGTGMQNWANQASNIGSGMADWANQVSNLGMAMPG